MYIQVLVRSPDNLLGKPKFLFRTKTNEQEVVKQMFEALEHFPKAIPRYYVSTSFETTLASFLKKSLARNNIEPSSIVYVNTDTIYATLIAHCKYDSYDLDKFEVSYKVRIEENL